jgi:carboxyl-terminal processing protease
MKVRWYLLLVIAAAAFFGGGWILRQRLSGTKAAVVRVGDDEEATGRLFRSVFQTIRSHAVDSLDDQAIYRMATSGVLAELGDPYAALIPGNDSGPVERLGEPPEQGAYLDQPDGFVEVVAVVTGSPADQAGLRAGDAILRIGATPMESRRAEEARALLAGPDGTSVRIRVGRAGASGPLWVTVTRGPVPPLPNAAVSALTEGVAIVKLNRIDSAAAGLVHRVLDSLESAGGRGLAIDLRGVVEGRLPDAVALADEFLPRGGTIVTARARAGTDSVVFRDRGSDSTSELPVVVLVDRATAGAAEVVAGALQDHDRGLVIGEVTFGRGAGQRLFPLGNGSTLRLTTTVWVTPSGRVIQRFPPRVTSEGTADTATARPTHRTDAGRTVLGGGGIVPDREVQSSEGERPQTGDPSLALARELLTKARTRKALLAAAHQT